MTSQNLETYIPVYDAIPERWEDARSMLVERMKVHANGINIRSIGWMLDVELLSGNQFIPSSNSGTSQQYRSVFRKVISTGALVAGLNAGVTHGITVDANFTLIDLWVAGTNTASLTSRVINGDNVLMNSTQLIITSPQAFTRSFAQVLYIQEV